MDDAWQSMQEAGAALLTAPGGSPISNPFGIKGCIAQVQGELRMLPIEELGSCDNALQVIGTQLRACDGPALWSVFCRSRLDSQDDRGRERFGGHCVLDELTRRGRPSNFFYECVAHLGRPSLPSCFMVELAHRGRHSKLFSGLRWRSVVDRPC